MLVIALDIDVEIGNNILIAEIEHQCGVESHSAKAGFKVKMRTGASSRVAAKPFVLAAPAGTEVACHHAAGCGHTEMAKIYAERVGHLSGTMGVAVGPIVVELCCRRLRIFFDDGLFQDDGVDSLHPAVYRSLAGKKVLTCHGHSRERKQ